MSDARSVILERVERALRTARIPEASRVDVEAGAAPAGRGDDRGSLRDRFVAEATALGVEAFVEATPEAVRARVAELIGGRRVLTWDADQLPYGVGTLVGAATRGSSSRDEQAAAEVGLTACHGAIAETGSLALVSLRGCARAVSLLPPVHVAVVRPEDLFEEMGEFFAARAAVIGSASNLTFVTGPSRTADIELSLTIGVHGPGRVVVVIGP